MPCVRPTLSILLPCVVAFSTGCAPRAGVRSGKILPLKRLRLYETGVGYFERSGRIQHGRAATLPVPAGHIDDALKTLTVIAKDGKAHVSGVSFSSNLSGGMARALAGLAPDGDGPVSFRDVLLGLRGQGIDLQLRDQRLSGAVIHLKKEPVPPAPRRRDCKDKEPTPAKKQFRDVLLFLDGSAKIRRVLLKDVISIRPRSPALQKRLKTALTALTKSGRQKRRALELLSSAKGPITLGYVAETPLFRVSYRLFAQEGVKRQTIQGWTLVHNDSDEDWQQVELSLVSGRPDSFLFPLTVPRYLRRPLVHPKRALPSVPQLINTTPDALWGDQLDTGAGEAYGVGGLGVSGSGRGGGGVGYGSIGLGKMGTIGRARGSAQLRVGNLAAFSRAKPSKSGTLFRYRMTRPLDLAAHGSALLPFTQSELGSERITLVESFGASARATTLLVNSTRQTLPAGTIAFYAKGIFVGESFLPRTKPRERHFLQHGTDLDVELKRTDWKSREALQKLTYKAGQLEEHFIRTRDITLTVENRDGDARRVYLRLSVTMNAKVEGADALDFVRDTGRAYAIFDVPNNRKLERKLRIAEGLSRTLFVATMPIETLKRLSDEKKLTPHQRTVLLELVAKRAAMDKEAAKLNEVASKRRRIDAKLRRLRMHLRVLGKKTGNTAAPIVKRILATEDALTANQSRKEALQHKRELEKKALIKVLEKLDKQS